MRWGSHEIMSFDICMAIRAALQNCDGYDFKAFGAKDSPELPSGAEVAYFPLTNVVIVYTGGQRARTFEVPWSWRLTLPAVLDLLDDYSNPDSFMLPINPSQ
jgi:hypothetical protein